MAAENIIQAHGIQKIYSSGDDVKVYALRGVDLEVKRGEFLAIMGASGSGKSTFMNILGCLDEPTSGAYILDGEDVSKYSRNELAALRNRKLGFVFQSFNLLPRTPAIENVELPLLYDPKVNARDRRQRALAALESVKLGDRINSLPNQLSGGQQQRVAIARAIINNPVLLLADEPTGNLDSRTSIEVMDIFQKMNSQGITVVIVTHEPDIAQFTQRNVYFKDGRIIRDIRVENVRDAAAELAAMPVAQHEELPV